MSRAGSWILLTVFFLGPAGFLAAAPETDYLYPSAAILSGATSAWYDATDNAYFLRFVGDETIQYKIDLDDPGIQGGYLRIYETSKACYPVYNGGFLYTNNSGGTMTPDGVYSGGLETLVSHSLAGTKLTLRYRTLHQSVTIYKKYEIELVGKALKVRAYSDSARVSYYNNYMGFSFGTTENTPNAERVLIPYMEAMRTTMVNRNYFIQLFIDYTQSRASFVPNPSGAPGYLGGSTTRYINSFSTMYWRDSNDQINKVDETVWVTVTQKIDDLFVRMSDPPASPYRQEFNDAYVLDFPELSSTQAYQRYTTYLETMYNYGVRNLMIYIWGTWAWGEGTGWPKSVPKSSLGGSEQDFVTMINTAKARGNRIGLYTYYHYYLEQNQFGEANPLFNPNDATKNRDGTLKYWQDPIQHWLAPDASIYYGNLVEQEIQDLYHINLAYEDSTSGQLPSASLLSQYAPDGHVNNIRDGYIAYKNHFLNSKGTHHGPYLGEGDLVVSDPNKANFDTLYAGYVDGLERHLGYAEGQNNNYYVIPDFELRVVKPNLVGLAFGFPQRFISSTYPIPQDKFDELLATIITYGHVDYITCNGFVGNVGDYITEGDEIRSCYMLPASLQPLYMSSAVDQVAYWNGSSYVDLTAALKAGMDLVNPRVRVTYQNGLAIYVNHSDTSWTVSAAGTSFTLQKNAWVAYQSSTGFLQFSAIPAGYSLRFDYVYSPNRFEMIDGRGVATTYGTITATNFKVRWKNGFVVTEGARNMVIDPPPQAAGPRFVLKNFTGATVASLDQGGNLRLAGRCYRYSNVAETAASELVIRNSSGVPVALVDRLGNLFLKGISRENLASVAAGSASDFVVRNQSGQVILLIDSTGNASLLGQVLDSSI